MIPSLVGWSELITCTFDGPRFEDHGLDLQDLKELLVLRDLLTEAAQEIWRRSNPTRQRLPAGFESLLRLRFYRLDANCTSITIYRVSDPPAEKGLLFLPGMAPEPSTVDLSSKLDIAAELTVAAYAAISRGEELPDGFPRTLIPTLQELGKTLQPGERLNLAVFTSQGSAPDVAWPAAAPANDRPREAPSPGQIQERLPLPRDISYTPEETYEAAALIARERGPYVPPPVSTRQSGSPAPEQPASAQPMAANQPPPSLPERPKPVPKVSATLTTESREQFEPYIPRPYEEDIDLVGEVTAASLKGRASMRTLEYGDVQLEFTPEDEKKVTGALYEHEIRRIRVLGAGTFEPFKGKFLGISRVDKIHILDNESNQAVDDAPSLSELAAQIAATVPAEEWAKVPSDLAENVDHYLYGRPKQERGKP